MPTYQRRICGNETIRIVVVEEGRIDVVSHGWVDPCLHSKKPRWSYSSSTGILESPFMMAGLEANEINQILSLVAKNHGRDAIRQVILYINPDCIDEIYTQLMHYGFERGI